MNYYETAIPLAIDQWVEAIASMEPELTPAEKLAIRKEFDAIWQQQDPAKIEMLLAQFGAQYGAVEVDKQAQQRMRRQG